MQIEWVTVICSLISGLMGGLIGAGTIGWRIGRWQGQIEHRIEAAEKRLDKGNHPIDQVPVIEARLDTVIEEIRDMKRTFRENIERLVSREECDRRHET